MIELRRLTAYLYDATYGYNIESNMDIEMARNILGEDQSKELDAALEQLLDAWNKILAIAWEREDTKK